MSYTRKIGNCRASAEKLPTAEPSANFFLLYKFCDDIKNIYLLLLPFFDLYLGGYVKLLKVNERKSLTQVHQTVGMKECLMFDLLLKK